MKRVAMYGRFVNFRKSKDTLKTTQRRKEVYHIDVFLSGV